MDLVHYRLVCGFVIRVRMFIDTFGRFPPILDQRLSYLGEDVVQILARIGKNYGYPKTIRVDQGSEFVSWDLNPLAYHKGVILNLSRPGKPTDNSFIESFNGKLHAERLNTDWFMNFDDARTKSWLSVETIMRFHQVVRSAISRRHLS